MQLLGKVWLGGKCFCPKLVRHGTSLKGSVPMMIEIILNCGLVCLCAIVVCVRLGGEFSLEGACQ